MSLRPITVEDLFSLKFPGSVRLAPNGQHIVFVLTEMDPEKNGYKSSLWILDKTPDGWSEARQFTVHPIGERLVRDTQPGWSACSRFIYFLSNRSGRNQFWRIPLAGGEARQWTEWEEAFGEVTWSTAVPGLIAFSSRVPGSKETPANPNMKVITDIRFKANGIPGFIDPRPRHLFTLNLKTKEYHQVTDGQFSEGSPAFSPCGGFLAFSASRRPEDPINLIQNIWTVPVTGGEVTQITHDEGSVGNPVYSPDGKWLAYIGHELGQGKNGVNTSIFIRPATGGASKNLTGQHDFSMGAGVGGDSRADAGSDNFYWSDDSNCIYTVVAHRGVSQIYAFSIADGSYTTLTQGNHSISSFSHVQGAFAYVQDTFLHASDVYYLCPQSKQSKQLTQLNQETLKPIYIAAAEELESTSPDGGKNHGWLIKPINFDPAKKYPAILHIHGGPYACSGYAFFHEYQLMASRGYAVLFSNPRGSSGYGEKHSLGVISDWGGGDYADLMAFVDHACKAYPWIDEKRLGVTGGSYGGYMTNWIVSQPSTAARFAAAVTLRCISNMYSKYGVADNGWTGNRSGFGGKDLWDAEDYIMGRSPIRYAPNVQTPILIIHSEEDYRCPMEQAEQWFVALKRLGVETEFVRFAGENHELSRSGKPQNRADRLRQIMRWFEKYIAP